MIDNGTRCACMRMTLRVHGLTVVRAMLRGSVAYFFEPLDDPIRHYPYG